MQIVPTNFAAMAAGTESPLTPALSPRRGEGERTAALVRSGEGLDLTAEQLAKAHLPEKEKIGGLCRQFEAVLLRQILHDAHKSIIKSKLTHESAASGIYEGMVTEQLADSISRSGSFGFARSLEQELTRQLRAPQDSHEK